MVGNWVVTVDPLHDEVTESLALQRKITETARATIREMEEKLAKAGILIRLLTVRQVIQAGDEAIKAAGLNPWCVNEGLADGDDKLDPLWLR